MKGTNENDGMVTNFLEGVHGSRALRRQMESYTAAIWLIFSFRLHYMSSASLCGGVPSANIL